MSRSTIAVFAPFLMATSLMAGEITVNYISEKDRIRQNDGGHYSITLGNTDKIRKATRVDLLVEFFDRRANKVGEKLSSFEIEIPPDDTKNVVVDCAEYGDPCRASYSVAATVKKTKWVELKYGGSNEVAFEWNDVRWYLENRWDAEKKLTLRSFSSSAYGEKDFDGRVFPAGKVESEEKRYYRVAKEPIPGGYPENPDLYEVNAFWVEALPGFIVENGQRKKPGFLDGQISNDRVRGTIAVGEFVQLKYASADKKNIEVAMAPVCQTGQRHRALISKIRFIMGADRAKDSEAIEQAIRPWLEPVSIGEVAKTCGPNSGRLVRRWDVSTTIDQIESELGAAESRSETKGGEILAYGDLRLKFIDGKLAGFERRSR